MPDALNEKHVREGGHYHAYPRVAHIAMTHQSFTSSYTVLCKVNYKRVAVSCCGICWVENANCSFSNEPIFLNCTDFLECNKKKLTKLNWIPWDWKQDIILKTSQAWWESFAGKVPTPTSQRQKTGQVTCSRPEAFSAQWWMGWGGGTAVTQLSEMLVAGGYHLLFS